MAYASILRLILIEGCHRHFFLSLALHLYHVCIHQIIIDIVSTRRVKGRLLLCGLVLHLVGEEATVSLVFLAGWRSCLDHLDHLLLLEYLLLFITAERSIVILILSLRYLLVLLRYAWHCRFLKQLMPFFLISNSLLHCHLCSL